MGEVGELECNGATTCCVGICGLRESNGIGWTLCRDGEDKCNDDGENGNDG